MGKYYALVSGLPNLAVDMQRVPFTEEEFYLELVDELSSKDRELLEWLRLERANEELLDLYHRGLLDPIDDDRDDEAEAAIEEENAPEITLPLRELRQIAQAARSGQPMRKSDLLPTYMVRFVSELFYTPQKNDEDNNDDSQQSAISPSLLSVEDRLAQLYYAAAARSRNQFLQSWYRLNQTLRNVLVIYTCRKLGWDASAYIVGDTEIEEKLRTSKAKDFELNDEVPYINNIIQIAEEGDIARRERMIDVLRWKWLDEELFMQVFDIENILAYYIRIGIIERWQRLNPEKGEEVFRSIVMGLKRESNTSLQEFKNNTRRH